MASNINCRKYYWHSAKLHFLFKLYEYKVCLVIVNSGIIWGTHLWFYLFARKNQGDTDTTILHRFNEALGCTISHFALIAVLDNILGL